MNKKNYYEELGVKEDASQDDIKSSFRKLAKEHHPDINHGKEDSHFKRIQEAYETLSDEDKRKKYDFMRKHNVGSTTGFGGNPFGPFADFFNRVNNQPISEGQDIGYNLTCSFEETISGVTKKINFSTNEICQDCEGHSHKKGTEKTVCYQCKGSGQIISTQNFGGNRLVQIATVCPVCEGRKTSVKPEDICPNCNRGLIEKDISFDIEIPENVSYGSTLRLQNKGRYSNSQGNRGHCFIKIIPEKHDLFEMTQNYDIVLEQYINLSDAVLGTSINIPTIDGSVEKLDIPPGTNSGDNFVIHRKGLFRNKNNRADLIVIIKIETIKNSQEIEKLMMQLRELENEESLPNTASVKKKIKDYLDT